MSMNDYKEIFARYGLEITDAFSDSLETYYERLTEANGKFNLTAITERDKVFKLHFLDSLLAAEFIPENASVCDVGSGAGFPGLVLALYRPDLKVTLMDSLGKRVNFLSETAEALGVKVSAVHVRAEDAGRESYRGFFDVVTGRAVARLDILAEYCLPLVKRDGIFLAYKTDASEAETYGDVLKILGGKAVGSASFVLPDGEKRCVISVKKVGDTPSKFPRSGNKPRLSPLGWN